MASGLLQFASFMRRHTEALEMLWRLATCVSDNPERRSQTTCSRLTSSRARPICRPSSRARRMPARTLSRIRSDSSSAIDAIKVRKSLPIIPLVSTCSRLEIKTTPKLSNSSMTCKKCLTLLATRSNAATKITENFLLRASAMRASSPGRLARSPEMPQS